MSQRAKRVLWLDYKHSTAATKTLCPVRNFAVSVLTVYRWRMGNGVLVSAGLHFNVTSLNYIFQTNVYLCVL